jgi:hypothetical protein
MDHQRLSLRRCPRPRLAGRRHLWAPHWEVTRSAYETVELGRRHQPYRMDQCPGGVNKGTQSFIGRVEHS